MAVKPINQRSAKGLKKKKVNKKKPEKRNIVPIKKEKKKNEGRMGEAGYTFLVITLILVSLGLVMLLSASNPRAVALGRKGHYFFMKQLIFVIFGFILMTAAYKIDYQFLKKFSNLGIIVAAVLLLIVFLPGIGVSHNGSRRWINMVLFEFQPSELAKFLVTLYLAANISEKRYDLSDFKDIIKLCIPVFVVVGLIGAETHLSCAAVICMITLCILVVGGTSLKIVGIGGLAGVGGIVALALAMPSRLARIVSFRNPFTNLKGSGYQIAQSIYAIGSGGVLGRGLGQSMQKYSYLPEPYNDFIFSVLCEELGFIGAIFVILLFVVLIGKGMKISLESRDSFGMLLVTGIVSQIAVQTIFNIAVVTASVPNTGITLPFFSYGGTAIFILLGEIGVILNVSKNSRSSI